MGIIEINITQNIKKERERERQRERERERNVYYRWVRMPMSWWGFIANPDLIRYKAELIESYI